MTKNIYNICPQEFTHISNQKWQMPAKICAPWFKCKFHCCDERHKKTSNSLKCSLHDFPTLQFVFYLFSFQVHLQMHQQSSTRVVSVASEYFTSLNAFRNFSTYTFSPAFSLSFSLSLSLSLCVALSLALYLLLRAFIVVRHCAEKMIDIVLIWYVHAQQTYYHRFHYTK